MNATIRPTTLGLALMNAAVKQADSPRCDLAVTVFRTIEKNDRPNAPLASGYNRSVCDNLRLSPKTLSSIR